MVTIEPCCAHKHWKKVLKELELNGTVLMRGYGDMTLSELLPEVLAGYTEADVLMALPTAPEAARVLLRSMLHRTWGMQEGGNVNNVARLRLLTDARASRSPGLVEWAQRQERLELASAQQNDTIILVEDGRQQGADRLAIMGPVNVVPCGMWTAAATTGPIMVASLWTSLSATFDAFKICFTA